MNMQRLRATWLALLVTLTAVSCAPDAERGAPLPLEPVATLSDGAGAMNYTVITEAERPGLPLYTSSLIGLLGGGLELGGHSVDVPRGAVALPTLFSMFRVPEARIEVDLLALRQVPGGLLNVGELGFNRPVTLTLSYAHATNVSDPSRLKIMRLMPDGRHEILPSTVDTRKKTVSARLEHFSRYCMISD